MHLVTNLIGTLLMFAGFHAILAGGLLHRTKQEDLGRLHMSVSFMGGGDTGGGAVTGFVASLRGNDRLRMRWVRGLLLAGTALSVLGAAIR